MGGAFDSRTVVLATPPNPTLTLTLTLTVTRAQRARRERAVDLVANAAGCARGPADDLRTPNDAARDSIRPAAR